MEEKRVREFISKPEKVSVEEKQAKEYFPKPEKVSVEEKQAKEYFPKPENVKHLLENRLRLALNEVDKYYRSGNWLKHAKMTVGILKFLNSYPSEVLIKIDEPLLSKIDKQGFLPYLSIATEYAYRLERHPTRQTAKRFRELILKYRKYRADIPKDRIQTKDARYPMTIIRTVRRQTSYRILSENAALAILNLQFSTYGEIQMANGYKPEHFLRIAELLNSCLEESVGEGEEVSEPNESSDWYIKRNMACDALGAAISEKLGETGRGPSDLSDITNLVSEGLLASARDCIESITGNSHLDESISKFEEYNSCLERERGRNPVTDSHGNLFGSMSSAHWGGNTEAWLENHGYNTESDPGDDSLFIMSDSDVGVEGDDSVMFSSETYSHKTDPNKKATIQAQAGGGGAGTSIIEYDPSGVGKYIKSGSGSTYSWHGTGENAGTSYTATYDSSGNMTSEQWTDEDGQTSRVDYDENGDPIITTGTTPSPAPSTADFVDPIDGYYDPACGNIMQPELREEAFSRLVPKLDKLINWGPDHIEGADYSCLNEFATSDPSSSSCKSVALCLYDSVMDASGICHCGSTGSPTDLGFIERAGAGHDVDCGPDREFDPATGTCKALGGDGELGPGIISPSPPPMKSFIEPTMPSLHGSNLDEVRLNARQFSSIPH